MFSLSPGAAGRKAERPGGRLRRHSLKLSPSRVVADDASSVPAAFEPMSMRGAGERQAKLYGAARSGKFDRVAPDRGREAEGGVRLIFENSTVC